MGDTGSLALGGVLAGLAVCTKTQLLLVITRRPVRDHHVVGDHPGGVVQDDRPPGLPDGPAAASLRAARLGRDHDRGPVLADRRRCSSRSASASSTSNGCRGSRTVALEARERTSDHAGGAAHEGYGGSGRAAGRPFGRLAGRRGRASTGSASPARRWPGLLAARGARVTAVDGRDDDANRQGRRRTRRASASRCVLEPGAAAPGRDRARGHHAGLAAERRRCSPTAAAAGIPVIGDVELAWRLRPGSPTAAAGLAGGDRHQRQDHDRADARRACSTAAGHRSVAAGNVGLSVVDAVTEPEPYQVLAVELSSFQLHWSQLGPAVRRGRGAERRARTTSTGTATSSPTRGPRGASTRRARWPSATPTTRGRRGLAAAAAPRHRTGRGVPARRPGPGELGVDGGVLLDRAFGGPTARRRRPGRRR